jgi:sugar lactone lactonase YvrE
MKPNICLVLMAVMLIDFSAQAQNLFESDGSGNIYKFTPNGTQSTFASGLNNPAGLAFNNAGDLFVSSYSGNSIFEFTPSGSQSTFASGLNHPASLAFNAAGILFESDSGSGNIYEFTPSGVKSTFASGLSVPWGLAFDSSGNLFEADNSSGKINKFTPGGSKSIFASGLHAPLGLAFNSSGNLFEADLGSGNIYVFTSGGSQSTYISAGLTTGAPGGLIFNSTNVLFEANNSGYIFDFPPSGPNTFASGLSPKFLAFQPVVNPSYNQISGQLLSGGNLQLSFVGIVGANYALDRSFSLSPPNWIPQATNPAGAGGVLVFTNAPDATTNNFWRIRSVP